MTKFLFKVLFLSMLAVSARAEVYVTIIQGLEGTAEYLEKFNEQTSKLYAAARTVTEEKNVKLFSSRDATRENILAYFDELKKRITENDRAAVFFIGHGSYDGFEYKFNIPGPDITGEDITRVMNELPAGVQLLVNASSASGAISNGLESDSRVVISATRNGNERLATRFGSYFFDAFGDPAADINKNNAVTAREAYDYAERHVKDYYESQGQLATEHPVMSGDYADQFVIARTEAPSTRLDDPELANLFRERVALDDQIDELQLRKDELEPEAYLDQLQKLMIRMSVIQGEIDDRTGKGKE